jgi:sec-independent protein translocase protein TatA
MFGLGMPELIIIMVIVLMIFGAGKLPDIGNALGRGIRSFKGAVTDGDKPADTSKDASKA